MTIGEKIKNKREKLGMNQKELAAKLGYKDPSTINKVEKGVAEIPKNKVKALADILGLEFDELTTEKNNVKEPKAKSSSKKETKKAKDTIVKKDNKEIKETKPTKNTKETTDIKPKEVKVEIINTQKLDNGNENDVYELLLDKLDELSDDEIKKVLKFVEFAIFYKDN